MASKFLVVTCRNCQREIVIPWSTPLRTIPHPRMSSTGVPYIDVACPGCAHVFRYTPDDIHQRLFDTEDPDQLPAQTVWFGSWLECDDESCASHVLIESAMPFGSTSADVKRFVSRWDLHGITCYSGHNPTLPLELTWDSISASEK